MHKFPRICATNCPEIERLHDATHKVAGFNDYGRGNGHGLPSLSFLKQTASHQVCTRLRKGVPGGAPFLVFGIAGERPACAAERALDGESILGEFGHAASPLAESLPTGLTLKFANSGNVKRRPRAGKQAALGNWLTIPVKPRSQLADSKPRDGSAPPHPIGDSDDGRRPHAGRPRRGLARFQR